MLEPLFHCNLACVGCGKIAHPENILKKRLSVQECVAAVKECGAPMVSIAGGEPLLHKDMPEIVNEIIHMKRFVYLCTNALLLKKSLGHYAPSSYLNFSVHLDGSREIHDTATGRPGLFDHAVEAITSALDKGFRVTINCTLFNGVTPHDAARFFDFVSDLGVEGITVAPGYHYEYASDQRSFLNQKKSTQLFRQIFELGRTRKWKFNHTHLYLDFLAGNQSYQCTPWGNPTRNVFGWQKPCYLLTDEGHASSYKVLMKETEWDKYGRGRHPKCNQCMLHSGFEPTAVKDTFTHPLKALKAYVCGPRTDGSPPLDSEKGKCHS